MLRRRGTKETESREQTSLSAESSEQQVGTQTSDVQRCIGEAFIDAARTHKMPLYASPPRRLPTSEVGAHNKMAFEPPSLASSLDWLTLEPTRYLNAPSFRESSYLQGSEDRAAAR